MTESSLEISVMSPFHAPIALRDPAALQSIFQLNSDGTTVTVSLFPVLGEPAQQNCLYIGSALLNRFAQAQVTYDVDANGSVEVWPMLLENAVQGDITLPESPCTWLQQILNEPAVEVRASATDLPALQGMINTGKKIVFSTDSGGTLPNGDILSPNHAYTVISVDSLGNLTVYDPHGKTEVVPWALVGQGLSSFEYNN